IRRNGHRLGPCFYRISLRLRRIRQIESSHVQGSITERRNPAKGNVYIEIGRASAISPLSAKIEGNMLTQIDGFDAMGALHPRRKTYGVKVGHVSVGGGAPIVVQSMTNTDTADIESTFKQTMELAEAGS